MIVVSDGERGKKGGKRKRKPVKRERGRLTLRQRRERESVCEDVCRHVGETGESERKRKE